MLNCSEQTLGLEVERGGKERKGDNTRTDKQIYIQSQTDRRKERHWEVERHVWRWRGREVGRPPHEEEAAVAAAATNL